MRCRVQVWGRDVIAVIGSRKEKSVYELPRLNLKLHRDMGNAESASADELNTTKGSGESRSSITKFITSSENKPDWSAYDAPLPGGEFVLENAEGQARLEALKASVADEVRSKFPDLIDFICSASLRYRNGDLPTANDRVQNYLRWRMEYLGGLEEQSLVHDAG